MKKTLGKALSLFLCVIMLATMAIGSVTSYAEYIKSPDEYEYKIGENTIYYRIINNEVTISGCNDDTYGELVIPEKINNIPVRYIGDNAFWSCPDLTSVSLPDGVTSIGDSSFLGCSSLTNITFPNQVTIIGDGAFMFCTGLTNIVIPNSVTSIGNSAFYECIGFTSITIPDSVLNIGENAFYLVNNVSYFGKAKGSPWGAKAHNGYVENGLVYNDKSKSEFLGCSSAQKGDVVLPDSVISIGDYAFYSCSGLTSVTISNGVTSIGELSFCNCAGLTSIAIPNSVVNIEEKAFWGCKRLTNVTIPDSVSYIGPNAFGVVLNVTYFGEAVGSPWGAKAHNGYIENGLVYNDKSKTLLLGCSYFKKGELVLPDSITYIGNDAFSECSDLTSIIIPDSVTYIGSHAFYGCTGLTSIVIPDSVTRIEGCAFQLCTGLTSITISDSVTELWDGVFSDCRSLINISIPGSVAYIGNGAFEECSKLVSIDVSPKNEHYCSDKGILFNKDKTTLIKYPDAMTGYSYSIPDSVHTIDYYAFRNNMNINEIVISDNVEGIGSYAFWGCQNLKKIELGNKIKSIGWYAFDNTAFYNNYSNWSSDGLLYLKEYLLDSKYLTSKEYKHCDSSIKIKDGTVLIADSTFEANYNIVEVSMPDSLKYIGCDSFNYCENLKYVKFGSGLKEIGEAAFGGCPNMQKFEIGANDRFYTDNAGALMEKLQYSEDDWEYYEYSNSAKRLLAYPNGSPATSYTVAKDVNSIDRSAFVGCSNLKQILVENGNKDYASYNGALFELYENYYYSLNDKSSPIKSTKIIQIPAVGNRYSIPEKFAVNGVEYITSGVDINSPFQKNPSNPTILDVPKSISYINSYTSSDYICFEGTEDEWKNGVGYYNYHGDSKILFEAYGKDIDDLIEKDPDIFPEEHTITITENDTSECGIVAETSNRTFNEPVHIAVNEAFTSAEQTAIKAIADGKDAVAYNIAIVNEAGGAITNLNGNKVTLKIPESMIITNGSIDSLKIYHITSTNPVLGVQKEVFSTNPASDIEKPISVEVIDATRYFCFDVTSWSPFVFEYTQADEPFIPGESNIISIDLDAETLNMNYKSTATLNPIIVATGDIEYDIKFESSNPKVVSVDENGKVTALKKGSADITVTVTDEYGNSLSDTCKVNVNYTWWQWIIKIVLFGWIWY